MHLIPKRSLLAAAMAFALSPAAVIAAPKGGPLTMVVPAAAGSAPDIVARILASELGPKLGQTIVVDNRPGAGGIVAVMAAKAGAAANPDTLLLAHAAVATVTPITYRAAKYDLERDFEPVAVVADTPMLFVANASSGPKTLAEAINMAKAKPNAVTLGSPSRGSIPHLGGVLFGQMSGVRFNNIPMSSSGQAIQAIANGDAMVSVDGIAPLLQLVKSGRLKPLAVTSSKVLPGLEGIPLAKDTVPGLELTGWFMLFAAKGTPPARLQALNAAVQESLKSPAVVQKLQATANFPVGGSVADARSFLAGEKKLWAGAAERAGLTLE